jgi:kinesin family protein C1
VYPFAFDKVFDWNSTQEQVFDEISQLVQSALDGYRVCIFAYGQTGSGKTFTMEGRVDDERQAGMIPRAVAQIFQSTEALREKGWTFSFECSYLEIYNESIRDLLAAKGDADGKFEIKHIDGRTIVTDLTIFPVTQPGEIMTLLRRAAANRAVAETQCNEHSSRSHR